MWQLLKIEIYYHSIPLTALIIFSIQLILYSLIPFHEYVNFILLTLFSIVYLSTLIERNKIIIDKQNSVLPFSIIALGLERSILVFIPFIILIPCFYIINYLLFPSNIYSIIRLIGQFGFTLILASNFILVADFYFSESINDRLTKYLITTISIIFMATTNATFIFITTSLFNDLLAFGGIVLIYTWGVALAFLTAVSFYFRKSFL